ncbi:hypothetical protein [Tiger frog virus]|uniref:Uncharacterized protein n=1 Tax=Rana tigrina ranavirus TaxID=160691 RepID=Q2WEQ1_RTRV|nr:hypothetical protein [Tiger frog virus]QKG82455.1 hypothetical protein [Tiger frog virus]QKG82558.1 hypothetical protein [Tiger frog virus]QKG82661.1 hypothetical protein [Tiger frog virus]QKG82864.1 hypothetical protein [Tiger frog virus]
MVVRLAVRAKMPKDPLARDSLPKDPLARDSLPKDPLAIDFLSDKTSSTDGTQSSDIYLLKIVTAVDSVLLIVSKDLCDPKGIRLKVFGVSRLFRGET